MTAIAVMPLLTTEYSGFVPYLVTPDKTLGADGNKLQDLVTKIIKRWEPPRSLPLWPVVVIEPAPAQVEANQLAIALFRSWRETDAGEAQAGLVDPPTALMTEMVTKFEPLPPVTTMYVQPLPQAYNIFVGLTQSQYSEALMDEMLGREAELSDQYPHLLFNFHYLPLLAEATPTVPENATLIFSR